MLRDEIPEITFFDADPAKLIQQMTRQYEEAYGAQTGDVITLYPGDPLRIWLYTVALQLAQGYNLANLNAKRNFLRYADGAWLDNLSATRGGPLRLPAAHATTTMRFTFSSALTRPVTIPAGTRVSPDGALFFAAAETHVVPTGFLMYDVPVVAQEEGSAANGYAAGQIHILVDPIPFVARVANLDETQGGADAEDDENYRERIYLSPEGYSVAGPELAYVFRARQYSALIHDVVVYTPEPGVVTVVPVLDEGKAPSDTFLDGLREFLAERNVRPLTDSVIVKAPVFHSYDIDVSYYINRSDFPREGLIRPAVESALAGYLAWQKGKVGRDINPDELVHRLVAAGAKRVDIRAPAFTAVERDVVSIEDEVSLIYGGLEDD